MRNASSFLAYIKGLSIMTWLLWGLFNSFALNHCVYVFDLTNLFIIIQISLKPAFERGACAAFSTFWRLWHCDALADFSSSHHHLGLFSLHLRKRPLWQLKEIFVKLDHLLGNCRRTSSSIDTLTLL